jgi:hypothetical protein
VRSRVIALACVLGSAALSLSASAEAPPSPVRVAEASSQAKHARLGDPAGELRRTLERELATIDWRAHKVRGRYLVSATVADLSRSASGRGATCTVSAALRNERGALVAIVEGRARAEDVPDQQRAEALALEAAAQSAARSIPKALGSQP